MGCRIRWSCSRLHEALNGQSGRPHVVGRPLSGFGGRDRNRTGVTRFAGEPLSHSGTRPCAGFFERRGWGRSGEGELGGCNGTAMLRSCGVGGVGVGPGAYDQMLRWGTVSGQGSKGFLALTVGS